MGLCGRQGYLALSRVAQGGGGGWDSAGLSLAPLHCLGARRAQSGWGHDVRFPNNPHDPNLLPD